MQGEFKDRLARHHKTLTYIHLPANHTIWFNQAPKLFTTLAASFKQGVDAFGAAHGAQSAPVTWAQQNKEEKELEDLAHPLSNALYLHLTATGHADTAAEWEMELTDWRKLDEQLLLDKGLRLHTQLLAALAATPIATHFARSSPRRQLPSCRARPADVFAFRAVSVFHRNPGLRSFVAFPGLLHCRAFGPQTVGTQLTHTPAAMRGDYPFDFFLRGEFRNPAMTQDTPAPFPEPDSVTPEEFDRRLATDPEFVAHVRAEYEQALATPPTPETEHLYPGIRNALEGFNDHVAEMRVMHKFQELRAGLKEVFEERKLDQIPHVLALVEEVEDLVLDVKEPKRSETFKALEPVKESLRNIRDMVDKAGGDEAGGF